eukprot:scaffold246815_cov15-Tisochrysis_lutea.AAC.1
MARGANGTEAAIPEEWKKATKHFEQFEKWKWQLGAEILHLWGTIARCWGIRKLCPDKEGISYSLVVSCLVMMDSATMSSATTDALFPAFPVPKWDCFRYTSAE